MVSEYVFNVLVKAMFGMAAIVFICLYFVNAGYGKFHTKAWGWSVGNKLGWVLMEAPALFMMFVIWQMTGGSTHQPEVMFLTLFEFHYFQRSFIFPLLMKGCSRMPVTIVLMGAVFNILNGILQGGTLFWFPNPAFEEGMGYLLREHVLVGILLFVAGLCINWHSDHVIRHLRKPGDTRHYLPRDGIYRYVTSANYLGEILEWTGYALAVATPAAWVFPVWTAANLVPRAHAIHRRYCEEFGKEQVGRRKRIIPFIY
ncbi:MAG: DUF1295 domain-containing protein [Bacteroidaceae bacterium]|nr:DUF1295 domain-containing protein [Bacteroidaceae bacterium]